MESLSPAEPPKLNLRALVVGLGAAGLSAALLVLALPPVNCWPLGWVCLVPVLAWVRGRGVAAGFAGGMAALMMAGHLSRMGVFYVPAILDGKTGWNYLGFALFGAAVGFSCILWGVAKERAPWFPLVAAAFAVAFEASLCIFLPAHLALTQHRVLGVVSIASWGGIWACSYVVWVANFALAAALGSGLHWRAMGKFVVPSLATILGFLGLGVIVRAAVGEGTLVGTRMIGAIQTESNDLDHLAELNRRAGELGAELVIWPELSSLEIATGGDTAALVALASSPVQPPFVTSFEDNLVPPHNMAALFSMAGESSRYAKRKLFGGERFRRVAGSRAVAVDSPIGRVGLNICFDSCFPWVMRDTALAGRPALLALPTQDPRAPFGSVQSLHSAYNPFRSAEVGLPLVSAECTAYTIFVGADGRVLHLGGVGTEEVAVLPVPLRSRPTPYRWVGDWFLVLCVATSGVHVARAVARSRAESSSGV